ncbi:MAG TPA: right-handed parallel beta-helix repeat-containing protein [Usitatibacter sp.]|jgi:hypothetical protein|nr:right-handed parallel beta-helix repeat-containing protein [Usitatibacter sp.]
MNRFVAELLLVTASTLLAGFAHAQSFRTYLSSSGSDANPCTVTQPCRLLPAALAAVANGGEVWMLDSANYNAGNVNVAKSVTIMAVPGAVGSIVAVGGMPAMTINTSVKVALRNVVIVGNAVNPGTDGIDVSFAPMLSIEDCVFANLPGTGIYALYGGALVHVKNTTFRNIVSYAVWAENGPVVNISHSQLLSTGGIYSLGTNATVTTINVTDTEIDGAPGSTAVGAYTIAAGAVANVFITRSSIRNSGSGLNSQTSGAGTGNALITVSYSTVTGNGYGVYQFGTGSAVKSLGNNHIVDNTNADVGSLTTALLR